MTKLRQIGRVKVSYTKYHDNEILTECSAPFCLSFPKVSSETKHDEVTKYIVAENLSDSLESLTKYQNCLQEGADGELRIYLQHDLSPDELQRIQQRLVAFGVSLLGERALRQAMRKPGAYRRKFSLNHE